MEVQQETANRTCPFCEFEFSTVSAKNRHIKDIHNQSIQKKGHFHVICPLCREQELICGTYNKLQTHLEETYEQWLEEQKIETNYVMVRTKRTTGHTERHFMCNRSNSTGYESKYTRRKEKAGGSIKIYGVCPSRIIVKFFETGHSFVTFWKTHVGHEEEIRSQHLSNSEKTTVVKKLVSGVTVERIISDARQVKTEKLERKNVITRKDIAYLIKKHNVTKICSYEKGKGSDSVLGDVNMIAEEPPSNIKSEHNEDIDKFMKAKKEESQKAIPVDEEMMRQVEIETVSNFLRNLDSDTYAKCMKQIIVPMMEEVNKSTTAKRKLEKQDYLPAQRRK